MRVDIIDRVQDIRIRVLRLIRGIRAGDYFVPQHSASGLEFDTIREYQQGDDVRRIDWSSSVRSNVIMVRSYREEENRSIVLILDLSETSHGGSTHELKDEAIQTIALMIGCAADLCGDAVGVVILNDGRVFGASPQKGRQHLLRCAELIMGTSGKGAHPPLSESIESIAQLIPRHTCVLLITDGLMQDYANLVRHLKQRATCGVIRVRDPYEFPERAPVGFLLHAAGYHDVIIDSQAVYQYAFTWYREQQSLLHGMGVRLLDITAGTSYDTVLKIFLEQGV